jgi:hypothetical protein
MEALDVHDYRLLTDAASLFADFSEIKIKIRFSEGKPNLEAREDIKITDAAPIVRTIDSEPQAGDLVQRRWSWPGQYGKPVYNFRSDGREFASGRCLIPADGGWPVIECFVGDEAARMVEETGPAAGFAYATDQLVGLFGSSVRRNVHPLVASNWGRMTFVGGAYSHAVPGHAVARKNLALPFEQRLFFACEATHTDDFSTATAPMKWPPRRGGSDRSLGCARRLTPRSDYRGTIRRSPGRPTAMRPDRTAVRQSRAATTQYARENKRAVSDGVGSSG